MVTVDFHPSFRKTYSKIKDQGLAIKVKKQVKKIIADPEIGKPMRHARKGTREVYVPPYRLSYAYLKEENTVVFLDLYHKDEQ